MRIYLIRHPKPLDVIGQCYGRRDVAVGAHDVSIAVTTVRQHLSASILHCAPIYTSPLSRCVTLARAIATRRAPAVEHDLIEMDFGSWEGQSWDDVPRDQLGAWAEDIWGYHPGGGENAHAVADRWRLFVNRMRLVSCDTVIAVTHAGIIRVALAISAPQALSELVRAPIGFGSIHTLEVSK